MVQWRNGRTVIGVIFIGGAMVPTPYDWRLYFVMMVNGDAQVLWNGKVKKRYNGEIKFMVIINYFWDYQII